MDFAVEGIFSQHDILWDWITEETEFFSQYGITFSRNEYGIQLSCGSNDYLLVGVIKHGVPIAQLLHNPIFGADNQLGALFPLGDEISLTGPTSFQLLKKAILDCGQ